MILVDNLVQINITSLKALYHARLSVIGVLDRGKRDG